MFASLKNRIKEETGSDISNAPLRHRANNVNNIGRMRSRFSSTASVNSHAEEHEPEQLSELIAKVDSLSSSLKQAQEEKLHADKANEILLESVRVAQTQKDLFCEEQTKAQKMHETEMEELKQLLLVSQEETIDKENIIEINQKEIAQLSAEVDSLRPLEPVIQELRDEMELLRHTSQQERNSMTTTLAYVEEENRHLRTRMQIIEEARIDALKSFSSEEKITTLLRERKLLEQRLEEAHLQLSDIKSTWSGQNLALETQVNRLSQQVAEETTEKRKAYKARDEANERIKQLEFDAEKSIDEITRLNAKIAAFEEELIELNSKLRELQIDSEQQLQFERNKAATFEAEINELKSRLTASEDRFTEYAANAEQIGKKLRQQNSQLLSELNETKLQLSIEQKAKVDSLHQNAAIVEREHELCKELSAKQAQLEENLHNLAHLETELQAKVAYASSLSKELVTLQDQTRLNKEKLIAYDDLQEHINEKNKTIKMLNQRLADLKKTLQKEFRGSNSSAEANDSSLANATTISEQSESSICNYCQTPIPHGVIMDDVNFKYLKHVVVKFLTSREVEARHLIKAVSTLLQLNSEEEKLLHDTLNWKMSWFGSRPDTGRGRLTISIPPS